MGTVTRGYRIRAYPNAAQRRMLDRWFGATRWVWNHALEIRSEGYRHLGLKLTDNDLSRWLTQWKQTADHEWLAATPATCLTQVLRDLDTAFKNFFEGLAKYPKRKEKRGDGSLRFQDVSEAAWAKGALKLPKLGRIALAETLPTIEKDGTRELVPVPDLATLSRDTAGRYFVSFKAEVEFEGLSRTGKVVGVDLGLKHLATFSTGEKLPAPRHYANRLRYLRRQQRCLARRQKGSRRRAKQRLRVARAHAKVADARGNALHELTTRLVREHDVIAIEDLNVKALARGFHARSIHDAAFGEFRRQLRYKCAWYGRTLIEVDRFFPSSKTCSKEGCGHVLDELRLDVREWTCPKCGTAHDRDVNAAKNLLTEALCQLAGGDRRDYRVDGRSTCAERPPQQVLPVEARSGQLTETGPEPVAVN